MVQQRHCDSVIIVAHFPYMYCTKMQRRKLESSKSSFILKESKKKQNWRTRLSVLYIMKRQKWTMCHPISTFQLAQPVCGINPSLHTKSFKKNTCIISKRGWRCSKWFWRKIWDIWVSFPGSQILWATNQTGPGFDQLALVSGHREAWVTTHTEGAWLYSLLRMPLLYRK